MKDIFYKFRENVLRIFSRKNLVWHLLAIALTYFAVVSNFDWNYYVFFNGSKLQTFLFGGVIIGGLVPIFLPIVLFLLGWLRKNTLGVVGAAVAQAGILGWLVSSTYKAFTGRIQPPVHIDSITDISRSFQFGFLKHGIFWGWPSSHTTVAFAVATTFFILYPKNLSIRILSALFAFYVGIGVSLSIHWFSDFLAGAIIGTLIGFVVGKAFKSKF